MSDYTPLRILVIEDEAILAMELENLCEAAGHEVIGWATCAREAEEFFTGLSADLAFIDLHLADGLSGLAIGERLRKETATSVIYMTANPSMIPEDYLGALGVMAKPYTMSGVTTALDYLTAGIRRPPPTGIQPAGLTLAPTYQRLWHS